MFRRLDFTVLLLICLTTSAALARDPWTPEQANQWQQQHGWLVGSNYITSTAINQLEMWQADTFDPATIDRELGWAQGLGFTCMRVFLHDLLWKQDSSGFLQRMDQFLSIADKHHIQIDFVLFDSVWDPNPQLGKQREPVIGLHNSGWVQSPGAKALSHPEEWDTTLKPYVAGVVGHFNDDRRVAFWEVVNEPDNTNGSSYEKEEPHGKVQLATQLVQRSFQWARSANPSQPITCGVWHGEWFNGGKLSKIESEQLDQSDIISFHSYDPLDDFKKRVEYLKHFNRPVICTEYMARPRQSTFDPILGYCKEANVGAMNWGFVAGKSNTIYPWDSWQHHYTAEPKVWFHDIFRPDGAPYDSKEVAYIRKLTGAGLP